MIRATLAAVLLAVGTTRAVAQRPAALTDSAFAAVIGRSSEASGYFDTDNLISNEDSYLHPLTTLKRLGVSGGVYVGVGPDQNFSYIAAIRPDAAFIVDIRRDNLLEHLLFKAIFAESRNRADYLAALFGKRRPADTTGQGARTIDALLADVSRAPRDSAAEARVMSRLRGPVVPLADSDRATIARFHATFIAEGPALRFNTFGRAPQWYYPDFKRLASEMDRDGHQASFLASEDAFRVVKSLEDRNLVIPVVGDFAGAHALAAVADWMKANGEHLSAMYTSNVEQYLFRDGGFETFARGVERFPRDAKSVMIRSCFVCGGGYPGAVAGYHAVQVVQLVDTFAAMHAAGRLSQYGALVAAGSVPPR